MCLLNGSLVGRLDCHRQTKEDTMDRVENNLPCNGSVTTTNSSMYLKCVRMLSFANIRYVKYWIPSTQSVDAHTEKLRPKAENLILFLTQGFVLLDL